MIYAKIAFLFLTVLFAIANGIRIINKNDIPAMNVILQAAGIVGFIWSMGWLN